MQREAGPGPAAARTAQRPPRGNREVAVRIVPSPGLVARGCRRAALGFRAHAFRDDADLLDAGALGGVDHLDDLAIAQRGAPAMNIVLSLRCSKGRGALLESASVTSCLLTLMRRSAVNSRTICGPAWRRAPFRPAG